MKDKIVVQITYAAFGEECTRRTIIDEDSCLERDTDGPATPLNVGSAIANCLWSVVPWPFVAICETVGFLDNIFVEFKEIDLMPGEEKLAWHEFQRAAKKFLAVRASRRKDPTQGDEL